MAIVKAFCGLPTHGNDFSDGLYMHMKIKIKCYGKDYGEVQKGGICTRCNLHKKRVIVQQVKAAPFEFTSTAIVKIFDLKKTKRNID